MVAITAYRYAQSTPHELDNTTLIGVGEVGQQLECMAARLLVSDSDLIGHVRLSLPREHHVPLSHPGLRQGFYGIAVVYAAVALHRETQHSTNRVYSDDSRSQKNQKQSKK